MSGYDMVPWKLVFCEVQRYETCMEDGPKVKITALPVAPEPGRVPKHSDHVHIRPKLSADQRDARGDHQWRSLILSTARCVHGRLHGDRCTSCPDGWSPDQTGRIIGYTYAGQAVRVPPRGSSQLLKAWLRND